jgi:hypothetical protein
VTGRRANQLRYWASSKKIKNYSLSFCVPNGI